MIYSVKKLAELAGVSIRTLHYYDEIGLLKPSEVGENGYRSYDDQAVLLLQQILFFRELDFSLEEIREIMHNGEFELLDALEQHRSALESKAGRLRALITTVDKTIDHLKGKIEMSSKQMFSGFNQEQYEAEVRQRWGDTDAYKQSVQRWGSYTQAKKEQVLAEAGKIYEDFVANMDRGHASKEVQAICARWHENLRYFYDPTPEILMGLGQMYNEHPEFRANFQKMHPDLPGFLQQAIDYYCVEVLVVG